MGGSLAAQVPRLPCHPCHPCTAAAGLLPPPTPPPSTLHLHLHLRRAPPQVLGLGELGVHAAALTSLTSKEEAAAITKQVSDELGRRLAAALHRAGRRFA